MIITHPCCANFTDGLAKQPLKLRQADIIASQEFYRKLITYPCPKIYLISVSQNGPKKLITYPCPKIYLISVSQNGRKKLITYPCPKIYLISVSQNGPKKLITYPCPKIYLISVSQNGPRPSATTWQCNPMAKLSILLALLCAGNPLVLSHFTGLVLNYGISNTTVLETP